MLILVFVLPSALCFVIRVVIRVVILEFEFM